MASKDSKPHLTELSKNNDLPSESEYQEAFELRSKSRDVFIQLAIEIQRLQRQMADVQTSIEKYDAILSPARRLLPDILGEIFSHCLPTGRNPTFSMNEAPMLLTRVCSTWREIALTTPRIWAGLHILLPRASPLSSRFWNRKLSDDVFAEHQKAFPKVMECHLRGAKEWLARSGTCPLSISIFSLDTNDSGDLHKVTDAAEPLFQLLASFSLRWKHVDLCLPFSIYNKLETHVSKDRLSLLQSFRGHVKDPCDMPIPFMEAPNLQQLSLNTLFTQIDKFPLMWARLTDLYIHSRLLDVQFFQIIPHCRNLVTCQIYKLDAADWGDFDQRYAEVVVPKLEMMTIDEMGWVSHVVRAINAPSLKALDYRCTLRAAHNDAESRSLALLRADALRYFIGRCASTLRKLTLEPQCLRPEDLVACLRLAKQVSHLVLHTRSSRAGKDLHEEDFFDLNLLKIHPESILEPESHKNLLPKLEVLEVNEIRRFTDDNILLLLRNRMAAAWCPYAGDVSPLRHVKLQMARQMQRDIKEEALALAKAVGFEVRLELVYGAWPIDWGYGISSFVDPQPACDLPDEVWPPVFDFIDG